MTHLENQLCLTEHLMQMGMFEEAIDFLEELSLTEFDNFEVVYLLGECYLCTEQQERAIKPLRWAIKLINKQTETSPETYTWEAYYLLGCAYTRLNQKKKALRALEEANKLNPNNGEVLRNIGWLHYISNDRKLGRAIMQRAVYLDPENAHTYNDLAHSYIDENNITEASKWINKAMLISPEDEFIQRTEQEVKEMRTMQLIFQTKNSKSTKNRPEKKIKR